MQLHFHHGRSLIANLGDASPIEYGGYFVLSDGSGGFDAEYLESPDSDDGQWTIYRFNLDQCTYIDGILSDNEFHPAFPAWFAKPESERANRPQDTTYLANVVESSGLDDMDEAEMIRLLCSADPIERATAYREIALYHGWENFDHYPLTLDRAEVINLYGPRPSRGYALQYDPTDNPPTEDNDPDDWYTADDWQDCDDEFWDENIIVGNGETGEGMEQAYVGTRRIDGQRFNVWTNGIIYYAQIDFS